MKPKTTKAKGFNVQIDYERRAIGSSSYAEGEETPVVWSARVKIIQVDELSLTFGIQPQITKGAVWRFAWAVIAAFIGENVESPITIVARVLRSDKKDED